jgi:hypothetical protein
MLISLPGCDAQAAITIIPTMTSMIDRYFTFYPPKNCISLT